jgi:aldehyde dehydrogenase (NAD+)
MANSRIYVQESIREKYLETFKKVASTRKIGNPRDANVNHGTLADKL